MGDTMHDGAEEWAASALPLFSEDSVWKVFQENPGQFPIPNWTKSETGHTTIMMWSCGTITEGYLTTSTT